MVFLYLFTNHPNGLLILPIKHVLPSYTHDNEINMFLMSK
jgi:hypothetical protein